MTPFVTQSLFFIYCNSTVLSHSEHSQDGKVCTYISNFSLSLSQQVQLSVPTEALTVVIPSVTVVMFHSHHRSTVPVSFSKMDKDNTKIN